MPQSPRLPTVQGLESYVKATRNRSVNLKTKYRDDPEGLAIRLGLILPEKPVLKMIRLGIITSEEAVSRFGDIQPGLRDLVIDTCSLEVRSAAAVGPRGGGKLVSLYTICPTPDGWTTMGQLQVGDTLFDREGQPCKVTHLYPIYRDKKCYEMEFSDGSTIVCSDTHPWLTQTAPERAANLMHDQRTLRDDGWHGQWRGKREGKRTTQEIKDTLLYGRRGDTNHSIDNTLPIQFPKAELPVDPYLLGLWLGNGTTGTGMISFNASDLDIVRRMKRRGVTIGACSKEIGKHCYRVGVLGMLPRFRALGVLNNKHVPAQYLRASVSQRRWLLAGLMDTDGTCRNYNNNCQFDNMNEQLSDAVYELVVSLGWKATRYKKDAILDGISYGVSHGVSFRPTERVFRSNRKHAMMDFNVAQETRHLRRMIVNVREVPSVPVRCIEVDSPSHTYLVGEQMVPTHNSQGVSFVEFYLWMIMDFDALNLGGSELQAANVYTYLQQYVESHEEWKMLVSGEMKVSESTNKQRAWIRVLTASQKQTRSPHAGGIRIVNGVKVNRGGLLVIDEEAEAEPEVVKSALPTINTARPSINIRSSTFHNETGSFADLIDNHEEMGYKLYRWDVFDVCAGCECIGDACQSEEVCFREDHYETYIDPDTGIEERKLLHRAYCGGRAMYAEGWVPYDEIVTLWMRMKRHHETFEIEQMGSRPGSSGFVIKSRKAFLDSVVEEDGSTFYMPGFPVSVCVDWGCHDDHTEILTDTGWKLFKDVLLNQKVAQFNKDTRQMSFVIPSKLTVKDYQGELLHFSGRGVDMMVTPNHRMLTRKAWNVEWRVERADEIEKWSKPYAVGSVWWRGREKQYFTMPEIDAIESKGIQGYRGWDAVNPKVYCMDDWLEFLGYLLSEGGLCYRPAKDGGRKPACVKMSQRHPLNTKQMRACMDRLGIDYQEYFNPKTGDTNWTMCGRQLWMWWVDNIGTISSDKRIPRQFLNLSDRQLAILFNAMMTGDGSWRSEGGGDYHSTSEQLCSDFQELAVRLGYRAYMKLRFPAVGNRKARWSVSVSLMADRVLTQPERVAYNGKVYCCTVPDEFIVTRRAGCVAYQGNTVAAGVCVWQALPGSKHVLLASEQIENAGINQIVAALIGYANKYVAGFQEMACDIGGGGNYLNPYMREKGFEVRDVNFSEEKESAVAAWNITSEAHDLIIPASNVDFIDQAKKWRRKNGRIQKGNDHLCDAAVCYFARFVEELGVSHLRIPPKSFNTGTGQTHMPLVPGTSSSSGSQGVFRTPAGASFGASGVRRR